MTTYYPGSRTAQDSTWTRMTTYYPGTQRQYQVPCNQHQLYNTLTHDAYVTCLYTSSRWELTALVFSPLLEQTLQSGKYTVEPLHSGHCWGMDFWLLYGGGCCRGVPLYYNTLIGTRAVGRYIADGCCWGVTVMRGSLLSPFAQSHNYMFTSADTVLYIHCISLRAWILYPCKAWSTLMQL